MTAPKHFGYVISSGYHIAVCNNCHQAAFMSQEYRDHLGEGKGDILVHLSQTIPCCIRPDFHFHDVYDLRKVPQGKQLRDGDLVFLRELMYGLEANSRDGETLRKLLDRYEGI